jgi:hypothetical protein
MRKGLSCDSPFCLMINVVGIAPPTPKTLDIYMGLCIYIL